MHRIALLVKRPPGLGADDWTGIREGFAMTVQDALDCPVRDVAVWDESDRSNRFLISMTTDRAPEDAADRLVGALRRRYGRRVTVGSVEETDDQIRMEG